MKVDFNQELIGMDGKVVLRVIEVCEHCGQPRVEEAVSLKNVALSGLGAEGDKRKSDGEDKILRTRLGIRISSSPNGVELTVDEAKVLKDVAEAYLFALPYTRIVDLLEPPDGSSD